MPNHYAGRDMQFREFEIEARDRERFENEMCQAGTCRQIGKFEDDQGEEGAVYLADEDATSWLYLVGFHQSDMR